MTVIPFGRWQPDYAGVGLAEQSGAVLMDDACNVFPCDGQGYCMIQSLQDFASFQLASLCVGTFIGHLSAGGHVLFAGTRTKLYKFDTTLGWMDYTRAAGGDYNVPVGEYWSMTQFGSQVIFCNVNDDPQVIDIDTGATKFTALGGTPPKSRYVDVVGDFVILACQLTAPLRIVNSAINDATGWTIGTNLCDQQDFADGEWITGLAGGEYGWVVQEHAIRRMIFQPGFDQAFRFERVERRHGSAAGYSLVAIRDTIFFLSDDGFFSFQNQMVAIGHERVNKWFRANSDGNRFFSVLAFTDPFAPRIGWAFYNSSSSVTLDRVIYYDWALDKWSYSTQAAQFWGPYVSPGVTLEALDAYGDMDSGAIPYSLDDRVWQGGQPIIAAITPAGRLAIREGSLLETARLLTAPMQLSPSQRSAIQSVAPIGIFNGATLTVRVGAREHTGNAVSYTGYLSPSSRSGIVYARKSGRLHAFELNIAQSTGTEWKHAQGVDVIAVPDGRG